MILLLLSRPNRFLRSNCLPSGHPVKSASLRSASFQDGCAALDWVPGLRKVLPLMKRFGTHLFTVISSVQTSTLRKECTLD